MLTLDGRNVSSCHSNLPRIFTVLNPRIHIIITGLCCCFLLEASAQRVDAKVYLVNGDSVQGRFVALENDSLVIDDDGLRKIERSEISFLLSNNNPYRRSIASIEQRLQSTDDDFQSLDRHFTMEMGGGIFAYSPYFLSMNLAGYYNIDSNWSVGAGTSIDFLLAFMWKFYVDGRYFFLESGTNRFFASAGVGFAPANFANYILVDPTTGPVDIEVGNVIQPKLGLGVWVDTGSNMAFVGEAGWAYATYEVEETYIQFFLFSSWTETVVKRRVSSGPFVKIALAF